MRKTVSSVLLGLSLLSPACKSASRDAEQAEMVAKAERSQPVERIVDQPAPAADPKAMTASPPASPEPAKPVDIATTPTGAVMQGMQGSGAYAAAPMERRDKGKLGMAAGDGDA